MFPVSREVKGVDDPLEIERERECHRVLWDGAR